jgi:acyl dehydratase
MRYCKDLKEGESFTTGTLTVTREDILEFAAEFDPQPYHLDNEAADASIFGGLCASGWQVSAMMMRLLTDCFKSEHIAVMGATAVKRMRWKRPVFAGDTLVARVVITSVNADPEGTDSGQIECDVKVDNQDDTHVIELVTTLLIMNTAEQAHV